MIPKDCKRLAEVDMPIGAIGRAVLTREKRFPAPRGLPSTLHQWWARRPLASSRAVLLGLLWPDPCDPLCPAEFKVRARELLPSVQGPVGPTDLDLRAAVLKFIGDFASWDLAAKPIYLEISRDLVEVVYPREPPLMVDPFAGGGAMPLEALRIGAEAFASDLNPVACLLLKVMLEDIPRSGPGLADELRTVGGHLNDAAGQALGDVYPPDSDGAHPVAYLWARTVRCETHGCGAEIPLVRSYWLSRKAGRRVALQPGVDRSGPGAPQIVFELYEPAPNEKLSGTVRRANATCPACRTVLPAARVCAQLAAQRGGADVVFDARGERSGGARLLAVVTARRDERGREFRLPSARDYDGARGAQAAVAQLIDQWIASGESGPCPVPDEPLPPIGTLGFRVQRYGMLQWGDLFTARQKLAAVTYGRLIADLEPRANAAVRRLLAVALDKVLDFNCSISTWRSKEERVDHVFGQQTLPIVFDFAESNPVAGFLDFPRAVDHVSEVVERTAAGANRAGQVQLADATGHPLPDQSAQVWFTDPPYYDAVPYADLSDFFYVWLKRALPDEPLLHDPFDATNPLTPKRAEAVQDETKRDDGRTKDRLWFEEVMARAFAEGRRVLEDGGVGSVIFAHKTTEGWEALLSGMTRGGWTITSSWPVATESASRLRARESAALATSVHLVCRPRDERAPIGDWADVLRELPPRVGEWMGRLQGEGIRGADLVFACIGPALEIFSRYSRVETAEGRQVDLGEYLEKVWEVVGRSALTQILGAGEHGAGAFEEDARLTALFLWTLQSTNGSTISGPSTEDQDEPDEEEPGEGGTAGPRTKGLALVYDVVRRFAQPLGIHLDLWENRVIEIKKGTVRLLPLEERGIAILGAPAAHAFAQEGAPRSAQLELFGGDQPEPAAVVTRVLGTAPRRPASRRDFTTLDRVHLAMLLQKGGQAAALREILAAEQVRGTDFLRLANALSALYPRESEEKRLLDAMLLAMPR